MFLKLNKLLVRETLIESVRRKLESCGQEEDVGEREEKRESGDTGQEGRVGEKIDVDWSLPQALSSMTSKGRCGVGGMKW